MRLRDHPAFVIHELHKWWPPAWVKSGSGDRKTLRGEIGTLTQVECHPSQPARVFLRIKHQGESYMGALIVDDAALCLQFRDFLQNHIGRAIREIGDLEIDPLPITQNGSPASESKLDGFALNARRPTKQDGHRRQAVGANADVPSFNWTKNASALLGAIVDSSDDAIISKDLHSTITSWNKSAERLFGYTASEAIGRPITMIIPPDRQDEEPKIIERLKRGERVNNFETIRMRKDGSLLDISLTISPVRDNTGRIIGASKVARDITERRHAERRLQEFNRELERLVDERTSDLREANAALHRDIEEREKLQEQLRQSQKFESLGTLAAGVAHDLNNMLNIIQGYALTLGTAPTSDELEESIEAITETTKQAAAFVKQLLALARKAEIRPEPVDINTIVNDLTNLVKGTFSKDIDISLDLAPGPLTIMADTSQITQVLLNVCVNARDAMPDGGMLRLRTSVVNRTALQVPDDSQAQSYAAIDVVDTGTGMEQRVLSQIFEPFFTTKEVGKGTGLGLAVAYGIVKSHSGIINVESEPLHGTTFHLYFPMVSAPENLLGAERK